MADNFNIYEWKYNQLIESTITEDSKVENLIDEIIEGISGYLADDVSKDDKFLRGTLRTIIGSQYMNENSSYDLESIANQLEAEHPDLRFDINQMANRIDVKGEQEDLYDFGSSMHGETFGEYEVFHTDDDDRGEIVRIVRSDEIMREDDLDEEKPGLWANIRAKRDRGEKPAHKNSTAYKDAVKAGKKINKGK